MTARILIVVLCWAAAVVPLAATDHALVAKAVEAAVHARMGERLDVHVSALVVDALADAPGPLVATLAPDARFGERLRVILRMPRADGQATRAGSADVVISATRRTWVASRALARHQELSAGDVEQRTLSLDGLRIEALPSDLRGTRVLRAVAPGQIVLAHMLQGVPMVRRGDQVALAVQVDGLRVSTLGVAAADGRLGQSIRVTNADSGRTIVARVTGRGAVEVRHGS